MLHTCIIFNRRSSNDHGEVNFAIYRVMCPDHVQINGRWNDRLTCAAALQRRVHTASRQQGMIYNSSSFHSNWHSNVFTRGLICRGAKTTEMHKKNRAIIVSKSRRNHTRGAYCAINLCAGSCLAATCVWLWFNGDYLITMHVDHAEQGTVDGDDKPRKRGRNSLMGYRVLKVNPWRIKHGKYFLNMSNWQKRLNQNNLKKIEQWKKQLSSMYVQLLTLISNH